MKSNNFIERSIVGVFTFLKDSIFAEDCALPNGFLQSLDGRVKIISFLALILVALFTRNISVLFLLYTLCLFLALISKIKLGFFLKRTWIFIPLFSLFIALPAIFGPGTAGGAPGALIFVSRVITCVSFTVLLSLTTKHFVLLKALRIFKIPQIFIMILGMCYRYVYLFVGIIQKTYLAISSRIGQGVSYQKGQEMVAWNIVSLWERSAGLNEEVYKAMLSRGYQGEALAWNDFKVRAKDWLWLALIALIVIVIAGKI